MNGQSGNSSCPGSSGNWSQPVPIASAYAASRLRNAQLTWPPLSSFPGHGYLGLATSQTLPPQTLLPQTLLPQTLLPQTLPPQTLPTVVPGLSAGASRFHVPTPNEPTRSNGFAGNCSGYGHRDCNENLVEYSHRTHRLGSNSPRMLPSWSPNSRHRCSPNYGSGATPSPAPRQREWWTPRCVFCYRNGEEDCAHELKNSVGEVVCPVLSSYKCKLCGATGRIAHTMKYCPLNPYTRGNPVAAGFEPGLAPPDLNPLSGGRDEDEDDDRLKE